MIALTNSKVLGSGIKKRVALMAAGVTVATVLGFTAMAGLGAGVASANSGALVIDDFGCRLLDGNGRITWATSSHAVVTKVGNGNHILKCSVKGTANSTGRAAHFDRESTGYLCNAYGAITANWHNKVSKSGNSTLTCLVP